MSFIEIVKSGDTASRKKGIFLMHFINKGNAVQKETPLL